MVNKVEFSAGGKPVLFYGQERRAPLVILHTVQGEGEKVYQVLSEMTQAEFSFAAIDGLNWDDEMSPWPIPPLSKNDTPCTGGADAYLDKLEDEILPGILKYLPHKPSYIALTGYSLAGLFALYAAYRADAFSRLACVSGSFWYPDFIQYVEGHIMCRKPDKLYFSLGDKESRTRNKVLKPVEDNSRYLADYYSRQGIETIFELNEGNHFYHGAERMARGIAWILEE
ncbi:MAG: hypothetical protein K6C05_08060 [Anaerovibrio sp.]|uniref:alpha/beta hydrolase n=1 Tax=Anaerovibrio sp. TaxID=1872532 RepID=UPI0025F1281E|nr:alpha/beta hydrolase-fold protein [Anaerovibrio sp.]MCR5176794.1 hypothetical protein [Anaerovibrio sp.]